MGSMLKWNLYKGITFEVPIAFKPVQAQETLTKRNSPWKLHAHNMDNEILKKSSTHNNGNRGLRKTQARPQGYPMRKLKSVLHKLKINGGMKLILDDDKLKEITTLSV